MYLRECRTVGTLTRRVGLILVLAALCLPPVALAAGDSSYDPSGIANDSEADPSGGSFPPPVSDSLDGLVEAPSSQSVRQLRSPPVPMQEEDPGSGGGIYNPRLAVEYAHAWAYSRNGTYVHFGNDCTNFVSQVLHAGGWNFQYPLEARNPTDWSQWWYVNGQWSYTWDSTIYLMRYMQLRTERGTWLTSWTQVSPGDIIFVDWLGQTDGDTKPDHSMVIDYVYYYPMGVTISQHTNDRSSYDLYNDQQEFPNAIWWVFHPY